jgi:succinate dehydrogenase / fumarate reductase membrane anchor subunit
MVNRVVVGAHYGLKDWVIQRVTAALMVIVTVVFGIFLVTHPALRYEEWQAFYSHQSVRILSLLFILSLLMHAWIGVRDIYMDYLHCTAIRLTALIVTAVALVSYGLWALAILWRP